MRGSKRPRTDGAGPSGSGGGGGERPPGRRNKYESEMVHSKPSHLKTKRGQSGEVVRLQANYFALLKKPEWQLYQYRVDYTPECEVEKIRFRLIGEQKELLGGYIFDKRNLLYLTKKIGNSDEPVEVESKDREGNVYKVMFRLVGMVTMDTKESLQTLNLILKKAMKGLKLQQIGRNCFDAAAKVCVFFLLLFPFNNFICFFSRLILINITYNYGPAIKHRYVNTNKIFLFVPI